MYGEVKIKIVNKETDVAFFIEVAATHVDNINKSSLSWQIKHIKTSIIRDSLEF
ncbi:MAG: hypothetical protein LBU55_04325 [Elusimicrobiota bacterium]|nr:hypothetical protein [Elusimicrobiota bacterium]